LRKAILLNKMHHDGIVLSEEIVDFIATNVCDNVRDLEGVLASLLAYSTLSDKGIDLDLARDVVGRIVTLKPRERNMEDIMAAVSEEFNVSRDALVSDSRQHDVVVARQVSMFLSKSLTTMTLADIGRCHGNRTHATVAHALDVLSRSLAKDVMLGRRVNRIKNQIAG
jgi:chromosomal replication initiator protein